MFFALHKPFHLTSAAPTLPERLLVGFGGADLSEVAEAAEAAAFGQEAGVRDTKGRWAAET